MPCISGQYDPAVGVLLQIAVLNAITEHVGAEFTSNSTTAYDMLVGRDIICQGVLTMDFSGRFSFSI